MSISIYYTAKRATPVSPTEQAAIDALLEEYSVDDELDDYLQTPRGTLKTGH